MAISLRVAVTTLLALVGGAMSQPDTQPPHRLIHQFPKGVWIENIAVRRNGNLLLTTLTPNASLYQVINPASKNPSTELLFTTKSVNSFLGISELCRDRFAILGGNHTPTAGLPGQWSVWTVDFTSRRSKSPQLAETLPDAVLLNGASSVPGFPNLILAADSTRGVVFRVNMITHMIDITQDLPEMKPRNGTALPIGINGLRMRGNHLYFTNSATHTFYRIRVNKNGTTTIGAKVETVNVIDASFADDFAFGPGLEPTAWVVTNYNDSIVAVRSNGQAQEFAGGVGSPIIPSDTSCRFGRTLADRSTLYVTTAGTESAGGKVEAIDVSGGRRLRSARLPADRISAVVWPVMDESL